MKPGKLMRSVAIAVTTLVFASLIAITAHAQVTGSSTTITRALHYSDAGKVNANINALELTEIFAQANSDTITMGIFPIQIAEAPVELQFYFPGISGSRPVAEDVPLLYYIEITQPLSDKFAGITFYYSAADKQMEYFVLESNGRHVSDSATCKCPPECCSVSVIAEGVAASCNTEATTCLPAYVGRIFLPSSKDELKKKNIRKKNSTYIKPTKKPGTFPGEKKTFPK
ncbi:MAG: hypothetical protein ABI772_07070 [Bacteroidota bacterium]